LLAIPIEDRLLYVEPIYLQAETSAYPELRLVAVMQDDDLSYAESLDQALDGLIRDGAPPSGVQQTTGTGKAIRSQLATRARGAFEAYRRLMGEGRFNLLRGLVAPKSSPGCSSPEG
jgi:uncharacterized membrane protein (UPF0182 family)